jgi:hypothetical protein
MKDRLGVADSRALADFLPAITIDERIEYFSALAAGMRRADVSVEPLDRLFVEMLKEAWRGN